MAILQTIRVCLQRHIQLHGEMIAATAFSPDLNATETHDLISRHFHIDPVKKDNALIHFLKDNRETFLGGVRDMLQKHGRRGTPCRTPLRMTARLYMFLGQLRQRARHGQMGLGYAICRCQVLVCVIYPWRGRTSESNSQSQHVGNGLENYVSQVNRAIDLMA